MMDVIEAASYISDRYLKQFGKRIDEMKLHKLLYFSQRESLIQLRQPLFDTAFRAWKYGPVIIEIRALYKEDKLVNLPSEDEISKYLCVFDAVFDKYAGTDSWSLSAITHDEYCWKKARTGIPPGVNSDVLIELADIIVDAERIRQRRFFLKKLKIIESNAPHN
ncbi:MAG: DUF4065 domain-containing protein [Bacteroidales bacterium]|nr:DUF4065 domain-containing protein [Bacteroidales bacterium]MBQ9174671.1 DUF4065 domain-containing protein [Bacteroidales bacterium]